MHNSRYTVMYTPVNVSPKNADRRSTSTPFMSPKRDTSFLSTTRLTPNKGSPRYALSETRSPQLSFRRSPNVANGPLLASTRFNVNLTTYTDVKSPGFSSRIVQYNNEKTQSPTPTHQRKYGSPGLFPVVHFFKKELPVITPKQNKLDVRRIMTDATYTVSPVGNRIDNLQEHQTPQHDEPDISTRSVLDALKEISRKRLHAGEDYETEQDIIKRSKRLGYTMNEYSKRTREDSPPLNNATSPSGHGTKRVCVVDPVYASATSYQLFIEKGNKRKARLSNELLIQEDEKKQRTLSNAGTQTTEKPRITTNVTPKEILPIIEVPKIIETPKKREEIPLPPRMKVFNERPLETHKKNKLASLLSALTNEEVKFIGTDIVDTLDERGDGKKLVSIISPQNKSKHDKHVHFNLNASSVSILPTETKTPIVLENVVITPVKVLSVSVAETPKIISNPIPAVKLNFNAPAINDTIITSIETVSVAKAVVTTSAAPMFSFGSSATTAVTTAAPLASPPKAKTSGFHFNLSPSKTEAATKSPTTVVTSIAPSFGLNASTVVAMPIITSAPIQSFGFGTSKPTITGTTAPAVTTASFTFNGPPIVIATTNATVTTTSAAFSFGGPVTTSAAPSFGGFSVATKTTPSFGAAQTTTPSFGASTNVPATATTAMFGAAAPTFGSNLELSTSAPPSFGLVSASAAPMFGAAKTTTTPSFGAAIATPMFGANAVITATPPSFGTSTPSFGSPITSAAPITFGAAATSATSGFSITSPSFGVAKSAAPTFGTPAAPPAYGSKPATTFGGFGAVAAVTTSQFGSPATGAPTFGSASSTFGTAPSSAPPPTYGASTAPSFGTPAATTTAPPAFGASNMFGSTFGTATTTAAPSFGTPTTSAGPVFSFGKTVTSTFNFGGSAQPPSFGAATAQAPSFGTPTNQPAFGASATTQPAATFGAPTTQTSSFGAAQPPSFGSTASTTFGAKPISSVFGSTAAPSFGAATTNGGFGDKPASTFGSPAASSGFGSTNTFGGATSAPAFGSTNAGNSFGTSSFGASSFGGGDFAKSPTSSTFGVAVSAAPSFGSTPAQSTFGSFNGSSAAPAPSGGVFAFGNAPAAPVVGKPNGIFSFGSPEAPKAGGYNFSGGASAPAPSFGTPTPSFGAPSFGAPQTNNFNCNGTPQFGTPTNGGGNMFNIGSGASTRPRTQLKAKRRT